MYVWTSEGLGQGLPKGKSKSGLMKEKLQEQMGIIASAINQLGVDEAKKHEGGFADAIFNQMHPERGPRFERIKKTEPQYEKLRQDWLDARDLLIRPLIGAIRIKKEDLSKNPLPTSHLEPSSIPTKADILRICRPLGKEVAWRCKEEQKKGEDYCNIQRVLAEAACIKRIFSRKKLK